MKHDIEKDKAIFELFKKYGERSPNVLRSKNNIKLKNYLFELFPMLQDNQYTDGMRLYWFINGIKDFPICENRFKDKHKNKTNKCRITGYETQYCCSKCAHTAGYNNGKQTRFAKYGSETWNNPQKRSETNLIKYGCENAASNKNIINKIQKKRKSKLKAIMKKAWSTRKANSTEKFSEFPYWDKLFLQFLDKSGIIGFELRHYSKQEKINLRFKIKAYKKMIIINKFKPDFDINEWLANTNPYKYEMRWICPCGHHFTSILKSHYKEYLRCPICDPYLDVGTSKIEKEMQEFLNLVWPHPQTNRNRRDIIKPLELDDYIADKHIAFELDGLYTHCDINKKNGYHQMKTKMCRSKKIQLVHIFEDEWHTKRNICESYIKNLLGINRQISAKKLQIKKIAFNTFENFANENCIDLPNRNKTVVCYGIYENENLIYAAGFNNIKANKYEMERPCSLIGTNVIDGIDHILDTFIKEFKPSYIMLKIDRRWFDETSMLYNKKMKLSRRERSDFYYVNYGYNHRYRKNTITNEVLSKFKHYDTNANLEENIKLCKFAKIYDCGQLIYTWKKKDQH